MSGNEADIIVLLLVPIAAKLISIFVPSDSKTMKVIDIIALNVGKARNDPNAQ